MQKVVNFLKDFPFFFSLFFLQFHPLYSFIIIFFSGNSYGHGRMETLHDINVAAEQKVRVFAISRAIFELHGFGVGTGRDISQEGQCAKLEFPF
ncbi:hypothetical protein E2C01_079321 [Portunus trituberculatus]|uniref:Uncharacterized protein n=1 Tax=Portunus trituberculatus TaxID=210409 RepID=A0A5B7IR47_PORTR|nr:hypothetical protein [Portunus trituberculatus]